MWFDSCKKLSVISKFICTAQICQFFFFFLLGPADQMLSPFKNAIMRHEFPWHCAANTVINLLKPSGKFTYDQV
jgi:hypothetical protein